MYRGSWNTASKKSLTAKCAKQSIVSCRENYLTEQPTVELCEYSPQGEFQEKTTVQKGFFPTIQVNIGSDGSCRQFFSPRTYLFTVRTKRTDSLVICNSKLNKDLLSPLRYQILIFFIAGQPAGKLDLSFQFCYLISNNPLYVYDLSLPKS